MLSPRSKVAALVSTASVARADDEEGAEAVEHLWETDESYPWRKS